MTPTQELEHAVHLLRNPLRRPGLCGLSDFALFEPLVELLDAEAAYLAVGEPATAVHTVRALAVARAINTQEDPTVTIGGQRG
ncbi:hypothetical protein ABTZ78_17105 [Streptomyces bauhiniae]|uniref:hypothetical protein n=1 Tax=Streptomyces bauhiniae TaxID=2340725 RepID=UPI0033261392